MRRAWVDLLAAECAAHPLVLVLEDLHWGDLPSVKFVDAALRALPDAPLLVLALARPEVREIFPDLWAEREPQSIQLSSLGRRASERLVRDALGASVGDATIARLVDRAAGNAFYLEELIRAVAEGEGERLPETVLAMVELRLDGLPPDARRVLRAASVFGEVFWRGAVVALLGGDERTTDVARLLAELAEREVITRRGEARFPGEEEFAFRHTLVREAAYAMLTDEDRALGHRLAGTWLELSGEHAALVLAEHFERGGDRVRAPVWYWRAAAEVLEANDFAGALVCAGRGVTCGAEGETLGALHLIEAEAHKWRGENAEAEASGLKAMHLLPRGSAPWYAATGEVTVASLRLGHVGKLAETVEELRFCLATGAASPAAVMAAARAATGLAHAGAYDLAEPLLDLAEALVEGGMDGRSWALSDPAVEGRVVQARATLALVSGDVGDYLQRMSSAAALFEEGGEARMACNARVGVGYAYLEIGAYGESERCLREARAGAELLGLPQIAAVATHNLGLVLARTGALAEARSVEEEVAEAFRRQGDLRLEAATRSYLSQILVLSGDLEAAEREARAALALLVLPPVRVQTLATLGYALLAAGRANDALAATREATALLAMLGSVDSGESLLRLVHAEALRAIGEEAAARTAILVARGRIMERAAKIKAPLLRASFLERVPENARTLALAEAWRGEPAGVP
jgi:tetratricopeptide (TPR) repeat protein